MKENKIKLSKEMKGLILGTLMVIGFLAGFMSGTAKKGASDQSVSCIRLDEQAEIVGILQKAENEKKSNRIAYGKCNENGEFVIGFVEGYEKDKIPQDAWRCLGVGQD